MLPAVRPADEAGLSVTPADAAIDRIAEADRALSLAVDAADAVKLVAHGKALAKWAEAVHAGVEHARMAQLFVVRAMRNAGQRLAEAQERGEVAGRGRPVNVANDDIIPATLSELGVTRDQSSDWKRLAQEYPTDEELVGALAAEPRPSLSSALAHVAHNSGDNEWYTPPAYIEAARAVMGGIDLDPASSTVANEAIGAAQFYSVDDDGLKHEWRGRVWMNPPYAQPGIWHFCEKLAESYANGEVTEAIALVNNATETAWFQRMAEVASAICFPSGRIRFWKADTDEKGAPLQGQAVLYFGPNVDTFRAEFLRFGFTVLL